MYPVSRKPWRNATVNCVHSTAEELPRNPINGIAGCCARTICGHAAAAPPSRLRISLRLMGLPRVRGSAEATWGLLADQGALADTSARSDSPGRARSHWKLV